MFAALNKFNKILVEKGLYIFNLEMCSIYFKLLVQIKHFVIRQGLFVQEDW